MAILIYTENNKNLTLWIKALKDCKKDIYICHTCHKAKNLL